ANIVAYAMQVCCAWRVLCDLSDISKSLTVSVGGFAYIAEIAKNTPSAANIVAYAMQVCCAWRVLCDLSDISK
ncbi:DnaB-like helicase N-terminal domain-containing protein, partial [Shigella flexneri]|nr:DnaB-like helicase N-terminal domain-containing protein [Shigella flexneri]